MKRLMMATALAALGFVPLAAAACDAYDETMATTAPPASMASAPPAASKVPVKTIAKASVAKVTKASVGKPDARVSDAKVAAVTNN